MQRQAKLSKVEQSHAKPSKVEQSHARSCQVDFASYNLHQFCTGKYPRTQSQEKSEAKVCKVMQSQAPSLYVTRKVGA
jgi:hypothetical protein